MRYPASYPLTPEEKLFKQAFEGLHGGKRKVTLLGGLPGKSNKTGICINGNPFVLLKAYIRLNDKLWNEQTFAHDLYMVPGSIKTPSRFILITKKREIISSSFDDTADLACFAFFAEQGSRDGDLVFCLKGVFNKNISAVIAVQDREACKLWSFEAKQMEDAFKAYHSQGDLIDETDFGFFETDDDEEDEDDEYFQF